MPRDQRIDLRATAEERSVILRAAAATNMRLSEFAMAHLVSDARRVLADRTEFVLGRDAQAEWEAVNARPARDLPGLRRLMARPAPWETEPDG
jgi:uncharacterized protein (DUF1778 family)